MEILPTSKDKKEENGIVSSVKEIRKKLWNEGKTNLSNSGNIEDDIVSKDWSEPLTLQIGKYTLRYKSPDIYLHMNTLDYLYKDSIEIGRIFEERYKRGSTVDETTYAMGLTCLDSILRKSIQLLSSVGIYSVNKEMLLNANDFGNSAVDIWKYYFTLVHNKFLSIERNAQNERDYREFQKENRTRVVGGGFGLSGAMKGMLEAGAINAVTGATYSFFNMLGNSTTDKNEQKSKQELYSSPVILNTLKFGISMAAEAIKREVIYVQGGEAFTIQDNTMAESIMQNIKNGHIQNDHLEEALIKVFSLNPYNKEAYNEYLCNFGDVDNTLEKFSKNFFLQDFVRYTKNSIFRNLVLVEFEMTDVFKKFMNIGLLNAIDGEAEIQSVYLKEDTEKIRDHIDKLKVCNVIIQSSIGNRLIDDLEKLLDRRENGTNDEIKMDYKAEIISPYSCADQLLSHIIFPINLKIIEKGAFCRAAFPPVDEPNTIRGIKLPPNVVSIGPEAFAHFKNVGIILLPPGLKEIGDRAFDDLGDCTVRIPNSVTSLGENVGFHLDLDADSPAAAILRERGKLICTKILTHTDNLLKNWYSDSSTVLIPDYYTAIEKALFKGTRKNHIIFHSGIREISELCFSQSRVKKLDFVDGLKRIGDCAFSSCYELESVDIPCTVTEIDEYAFAFCNNLANVTLQEGLLRLGDSAFYTYRKEAKWYEYECSLKSIRLPESLVEIGEDVVSKEHTTIECVKGSPAWEYARNNGYKYKEVPSQTRTMPNIECDDKKIIWMNMYAISPSVIRDKEGKEIYDEAYTFYIGNTNYSIYIGDDGWCAFRAEKNSDGNIVYRKITDSEEEAILKFLEIDEKEDDVS